MRVCFAARCERSTSCTSGTSRSSAAGRSTACWSIPGPQSARRRCSRRSAASGRRALLLTHIHFDHAGAAGALRAPLAGPARSTSTSAARRTWSTRRELVASAARLYGGERGPRRGCGARSCRSPRRTCTCSRAARRGVEGAFRVEYTPGHASHHVCYLHEPSRHGRSSATWPACGSRRATFTLAPTPPPDIDVEAWERSLDTIAGWQPEALGADPLRARSTTPPAQLERVRASAARAGRARRAARRGRRSSRRCPSRVARERRRGRRRDPPGRAAGPALPGPRSASSKQAGAGTLAIDVRDDRAPARRAVPAPGWAATGA